MRLRLRKRRAAPISCRELVGIVSDYLEGALPKSDATRVESHLELCNGCSHYVEQLRTTVATSGRLRESELDPVMRERLLAAFRGWHEARG